MYRRSLVTGAIVLLLSACAQNPTTAGYGTPRPSEDALRRQIIASNLAHAPLTSPSSVDITYNSHYPPHFPAEAIRAGHEGTVILMITIDAKGVIQDIRVDQSSGYPELDASAIDAAWHWLFIPATKNGIPQPGSLRTPVNFGQPLRSNH